MKKRINFEKILKNKEKDEEKHMIKKKKRTKVIEEPKEKTTKKVKKHKRKFRFFYWLIVLFVFFALCAFVAGVGFCYYIVKSAPEFDEEKMFEKEASRLYDSKGVLFATLGTEQRQKVTYDELPQVLVDAIIATEDSRFFQHNGFDAPRFIKASISQVLGRGGGGASTLTMQLSKLAFTSTEASGIQGIIRKFTDIYMAVFKMEKYYTKEEIIEYYVNTPCMGGNIYGVKQAAQYYFGKEVGDLNLVEAAQLAGMFQSPNGYNPYVNPNDANDRKNTVLYLMNRHGYITDEEYAIAKKVEVKNFLSDGSGTGVNEYQGFIDTVVQEVIDRTGNNPYEVPMEIYTTMVTSKQNAINNFYKTYKFKDKKIEVGIGVINNKTGAIMAVGAGRNKKSAMTLNVATFSGQTKRMPGSTIKPILDYGPAIEYANLSTYGPFLDDKIPYGGSYMRNFNAGSYKGFMTMRDCLKNSINTCALQAFRLTSNDQKLEFATGLGIDFGDTTYLPDSYSIGAFNGVSPVQLAGAYAAFGNGGTYHEPHSFTKIIYNDTEEEYVLDVKSERVMKPSTAYMIATILTGATTSRVNVSGTQVATKTGTTSYDSDILKKYGLNNGVIPDAWTSSFSPDYAVAIWYGYVDGLNNTTVKNKWYLKNSETSTERLKIQAAVVNKIYEKNSKFKNPGGITSANVELETVPAQSPSSFTPDKYRKSFLFVSGTEPSETSQRFSQLKNPINVNYNIGLKQITLSWESPGTPSAIDPEYINNYFTTAWGDEFGPKYAKKRISYNKQHIGTFGFEIYLTNGTSSTYVGRTEETNYVIDLNNYPGLYDGIIVKSAYSIWKANASSGYKIVFNNSSSYSDSDFTVNMNDLNLTIKKGSKFNTLSKSDISSIMLGNSDVRSQVTGLTLSANKISMDNGGSNIAEEDVTSKVGTYTVTYTISFAYQGSPISKTVTQKVTVQ